MSMPSPVASRVHDGAATSPILRFAPSPTGWLHLGHAYSALLNAQLAGRLGGQLLLRIEDIDTGRTREPFAAGIVEDLAWLGIVHGVEIRRQSTRFAAYGEAVERLKALGLLYPCICSRRAIADAVQARRDPDWPVDPDGTVHYPGTCRAGLPLSTVSPAVASSTHRAVPAAWRLHMERALERALALVDRPLVYDVIDVATLATYRRQADPARWGDVIVVRRDVPASYHLAVVVDDADQGVTHVVRGRDLEAATDVHVLLQRLLGLPTPVYHFHDLITDAQGEKLAKSRGSEALRDLRARGISAAEVRAGLGFASDDHPASV